MRFALVLAAAIALPMAASGQSSEDHTAHHPDAASAPTAPPQAPPAAAPAAPAGGAMDAQMKSMREMHDKMMTARTPEERRALMGEHMKVMQDAMAMMGKMKGPPGNGMTGGMSMRPEMMGKRMDMMEMMMQMMVDREAARAPASR